MATHPDRGAQLTTMDNWDPAVTNGSGRDREVILFNNAGISISGGETPRTRSLSVDLECIEVIMVIAFALIRTAANGLT